MKWWGLGREWRRTVGGRGVNLLSQLEPPANPCIYLHVYIHINTWVPRWLKFMYIYMDFPCGSAGKKSVCNVRDLGPIPGLGRSPGEGKGYPLQYCGLENSMDCIVRGVMTEWLSYIHIYIYIYIFIYISHLLYPFICWWTFKLLSYLGYYK